jgi:lysophospholipase L1-like esterase
MRHPTLTLVRCLSVVFALLLVAETSGVAQSARPRRIAVFGSSVANGTGDEYNREGYTGLLRGMLAARGWEVFNQSRGGDTTIRMAPRWAPDGAADPRIPYLLPANPGYVVIALSLANEGVFEATTVADKDKIFEQYQRGIRGFVTKAREAHIDPVVALCYPRSVYTEVDYQYVKRSNIAQSTWDVPTVNFLGAADDGHGQWARGLMYNDKHPNATGHQELLYAFVPTLFEALEQGKTTPVKPAAATGFARVANGATPLTFAPDAPMHSFAVSVMARAQGDGAIEAISGSTLLSVIEKKHAGAAGPGLDFEEAHFSADRPFTALVGVKDGKWMYRGAAGTTVTASVPADGQWHHLVLSHYVGRGESLFYVDGTLAGKVAERLAPSRFVVGGPDASKEMTAPRSADYKDLLLYRAALNADEVAALQQGMLLQASLEVYAPLSDPQFTPGAQVENRAQSLSALVVGSPRIAHGDDRTR